MSVRRPHELEEIRRLADAQEDAADRVAILLMGRLGFRKNDVRMFQVRDVDLAEDVVYIERGKGGKGAILPIAFDDLREALSEWLSGGDGQTSHEIVRHPSSPPESYLWHPRGRPLEPADLSTVHRRFKRCLARTKGRGQVADFPMHELRHSAADRLWRKTGDLMAASQLLRHSNPATTRTYLHPRVDDLRERMIASDDKLYERSTG